MSTLISTNKNGVFVYDQTITGVEKIDQSK